MSGIRLNVVCANCTDMLHRLASAGFTLYDIKHIDLLTVEFSILRKDYKHINEILSNAGYKHSIAAKSGIYWNFMRLSCRPVLLIGILALFALTLYLPTRILFIGVSGNERLSTKQILENAEFCGIHFGISRQTIRSEKIKNRLLERMPELQWAGINTNGCFAVIQVQEKTETDKEHDFGYNTNIVAAHDGVITKMSVLRGVPLCKIGQVVNKGEMLISGYADYGIRIKLTGADGEISARTFRNLTLKTPSESAIRKELIRTENRYSCFLGKKLINFYKDSGISGADCVRMYTEYYLVLPGGLQLPAGFIKETYSYYNQESYSISDTEDFCWLSSAAKSYLNNCMISGEIMSCDTKTEILDGVCCLTGSYQCHELISRIRYEEILQQYE